MSLDSTALPRYFKRLRKLNPKPLKYYAVGEYGGRFKRPHYHAIIFNAELPTFAAAWSLGNQPLGSIHYGSVTAASVGYCLKYITDGKWKPNHQRDDRTPPRSYMSKRLGDNYLTPQMIAWHKADLLGRMYVTLEDGHKASLPRYYKSKIYNDEQQKQLSSANTQRALNEELDHIYNTEDYFRNRQEKYQESKRKIARFKSTHY